MSPDTYVADETGHHHCAEPGLLPNYIKARYKRIALVSRLQHVESLDERDDDTLIVSCDWLLWQQLLEKKRHIVHYELGILGWPESESIKPDLMFRANDWIYAAGEDPSRFRGVSLGATFLHEVSMCLMNYFRLTRSLSALIDRFQPQEILFFDFINDMNFVSHDIRRQVVINAARECGVAVSDHSEAPEPYSFGSAHAIARNVGPNLTMSVWMSIKPALIKIYTLSVEMLTRLRCLLSDPQKRVLVLLNTNLAEPLAANYKGSLSGMTPIFMARTLPKTLTIIWRCLRYGIVLAAPKSPRLSAADVQRIDAIEKDLSAALERPVKGADAIVHAYVKEVILGCGRLAEKARQVLAAEHMLGLFKPSRIVVDGVRNAPPRIYAELAGPHGIEVDYYWHSPLIPLIEKVDANGGDPRVAPMVTRNLSWGKINDQWLEAVEAHQPTVRVGCMLNDRYPAIDAITLSEPKNILMLQYTPTSTDHRGLNCNMYSTFVKGVRMLHAKGFSNIRVKLHPGPEKWQKEQFEELRAYFGLQCEILKKEPFHECVKWADIVIGPVQTGAFSETLAAGKPYYALMIPPHGQDLRFYGDFPLYSSIEELIEAFDEGKRGNPDELFEDLYSTKQFPSGCARFWEVLEKDFSEAK